MSIVLVTGGTGSLGRRVVDRLLKQNYQVHLLSRHPVPEVSPSVQVMVDDLVSGTGLAAATLGVAAIIHCASDFADPQGTDVAGTRSLLDVARANGMPHVLYISIVDVDRTTFPYYQAKREAEDLIERRACPGPFCVRRSFTASSRTCCIRGVRMCCRSSWSLLACAFSRLMREKWLTIWSPDAKVDHRDACRTWVARRSSRSKRWPTAICATSVGDRPSAR